MITRTARPAHTPDWRSEMAAAIRSVSALLRHLDLEEAPVPAAVRDFPVRVPLPYADRIRRGDPSDPLLRQVLAVPAEDLAVPGFGTDPLEEDAAGDGGLLRKYRGRALVITTAACAIHCRYCFRRHFPYADHQGTPARLARTLEVLAREPRIEEVILSGGDPLSLPDERLGHLSEALRAIPHVRRLRIHTRLPVVLPARVDAALLAWLSRWQRPVVVLHVNHPREIDAAVAGACRDLLDAGALLLNQAVLLAGVNDDVDTLRELSLRLHDTGVVPYYLHMLDPVAGTAHFRVPEEHAARLHRALLDSLPGYLVPRRVRELPGHPAKQPLAPAPPAPSPDRGRTGRTGGGADER